MTMLSTDIGLSMVVIATLYSVKIRIPKNWTNIMYRRSHYVFGLWSPYPIVVTDVIMK